MPIYWGEGDDLGTLLDSSASAGPVRQLLEARSRLVPLDAIEADNLAGLDRLLLAQPRPLAPSENVALDDWVTAGGRLVIFADPLLTAHSAYPLGDRRRPQDTVLLSPILARWGLALGFDEDQASGPRTVKLDGADWPVDMAGRFEAGTAGKEGAACLIASDGLLARCTIGRGNVTLIADAAALDVEDRETPAGLGAFLAEALKL